MSPRDHAIQLEGSLEPDSYYVVSGNNPTNINIQNKTDYQYNNNLPYNGNDVIELFYNNQKVDQFGLLGFDINFAVDLTMIRLGEKEDYIASNEYDQFNFIAYIPDLFENLKNDNHDIKTLEQLYQGPQLEQRYLDLPYVDPNNNQLGVFGIVSSTLKNKFGNTRVFVDMNRDYDTDDGDMYLTKYPNTYKSYEFYATKHSYENRVQASTSIFNFPEVTDKEKTQSHTHLTTIHRSNDSSSKARHDHVILPDSSSSASRLQR